MATFSFEAIALVGQDLEFVERARRSVYSEALKMFNQGKLHKVWTPSRTQQPPFPKLLCKSLA
jgi:hypothetical protein